MCTPHEGPFVPYVPSSSDSLGSLLSSIKKKTFRGSIQIGELFIGSIVAQLYDSEIPVSLFATDSYGKEVIHTLNLTAVCPFKEATSEMMRFVESITSEIRCVRVIVTSISS